MLIIYRYLVDLELPMVHAKFQDHTKNKVLKSFGHIGAWQPTLSCDRDHIQFGFNWPCSFREDV